MYLVSNDQIIHETIDNETMIVNLIDGSYYSAAGTGAFVWELLMRGDNIGDCIKACQNEYQCKPIDQLTKLVEVFVAELLKEGLIKEAATKHNSELPPHVDIVTVVSEQSIEFIAPVLHKYSDMQDLLLLDPIHDVDESGWPHPKNA